MNCPLPISECRLTVEEECARVQEVRSRESAAAPAMPLAAPKSQIEIQKLEIGTHSSFATRHSALFLAVLLLSIFTVSGCKKKKPVVPPPQAQAPTMTQQSPLPAPPPEVSGQPLPPATPPGKEEPAKRQKKEKPRRAPRAPKPAPPAEKPAPQARTVVPEGGTPPAQPPELTANISHATAQHQRMTTAQLLDATEFNLKSLARSLSADEQDRKSVV